MSKQKKHHLLNRPNPNPPPPNREPVPSAAEGPQPAPAGPIAPPNGQLTTLPLSIPPSLPPSLPSSFPPPPDTTPLDAALARVRAPNHTENDVIHLSHTLSQYPDVYQVMGDLGSLAQIYISSNISTEPLRRESILLVATELHKKLSRPTDTPLEQLFVEQCVNAYMIHYNTEIEYANNPHSNRNNVWDQRLNLSQKRFARAVETLARLRQLALPILQINVTPPAPPLPAASEANAPPYIEPASS